ncbi:class I adenylate-forming enzyme family protein [Pueribacillus theae]|uniref:class I adenylate-forming enzyme family protein n=1 Tax=Pueribacillus theae TaxID=2171751 RepID=UPI00267993BC
MDIGSSLAMNARRHPGKWAVTCEDRMYTYKEFNEEVNRFAHGLLNLGIKKQEKVALMMKNSDYFAICFYAAAKIGAVLVPINFRLVASEVKYILEQSDSVLAICDEEYESLIGQAIQGMPLVRHIVTVGKPTNATHLAYIDVLSNEMNEPGIKVNESDDLEILYTSGTTGKPKGVLLDHRRVMNVGICVTVMMGLNPNDRLLHLAPLFHSAQLNLFLISGFWLGASHVIHRDFHPVETLKAIDEHKITLLFAVPAMYTFMLQVPNANEYDLSSVQRCGYGAAPMAPDTVKKSMQLFQTDQFYNLCGLTEGGPGGVCLPPEAHKDHLGKGGKAMFLTEARVVDDKGNDVKPGEVGEFVLRGETIMKEYYKKPEETKKTFKDGWLYTGDLATIDREGYITLVDRKKDMIITGGENVYSIEVENVMSAHPQVLEAAAIGLPHEIWGEIVTAVVVPKQNEVIDKDEFTAFCRKHLAGYKIREKLYLQKFYQEMHQEKY